MNITLFATSNAYGRIDTVANRIYQMAVDGQLQDCDITTYSHELGKRIDKIEHRDWRLGFGRIQRTVGQWNDTAGLESVSIPGKQISLYSDFSGPVLYTHVGSGDDRANFWDGFSYNAKLNRKPRTHLIYEGSDRFDQFIWYGRHSTRPSPYLLHSNDLGRAYGLEEGDHPFYKTCNILDEFADYLAAAAGLVEVEI